MVKQFDQKKTNTVPEIDYASTQDPKQLIYNILQYYLNQIKI